MTLLQVLAALLMRCENALVQEDPWPYADVHSQTLIDAYEWRHDDKVREELEHRLMSGMLTEELAEATRRALKL
jgi:hypothetical protein